jgi:hypothetical protein
MWHVSHNYVYSGVYTNADARQTVFFEMCSTMLVSTHGAAIMLAAAHERHQAPPYGLVDTNKTIYEDHFSL